MVLTHNRHSIKVNEFNVSAWDIGTKFLKLSPHSSCLLGGELSASGTAVKRILSFHFSLLEYTHALSLQNINEALNSYHFSEFDKLPSQDIIVYLFIQIN